MIHRVQDQKPGLLRWIVLGMPLVVLLGVNGCAKISHQMRYHMHFGHNRPLPGLPYYHCTHCGQIVPKAGHECGITLSHGPFFGYNATCWRDWPEGWVACPIQEIHPAEVIEMPADQSSGPQPPRAPAAYPVRVPAFSARPNDPQEQPVPPNSPSVQELTTMPWAVEEAELPNQTGPVPPPPVEAAAPAPGDQHPAANDWAARPSRTAVAPASPTPERVMRLDPHGSDQSVLSAPVDRDDDRDDDPHQPPELGEDTARAWVDVTESGASQPGDDPVTVAERSPRKSAPAPPEVAPVPDLGPPAHHRAPTIAPPAADAPAPSDEPETGDTPAPSDQPATGDTPADRVPRALDTVPDATMATGRPPDQPTSADRGRSAPQYSAVPPAPLPGRSPTTVRPSSPNRETGSHPSASGRGLIDWRTSSGSRLDSVARRLEAVRKSSRTQVYMVGVAPRHPASMPSAAAGNSERPDGSPAPMATPAEQNAPPTRPAARRSVPTRGVPNSVARRVRHRSQLRKPPREEHGEGTSRAEPQPAVAPAERPEPIRIRLIGYGDDS